MKVRPLGNRILVKPLSQDEVTKSGIVLPATIDQKEKSQYQIVALGNGDQVRKLGFKVGDIVVAGKYSGDEIEVGDDKNAGHKILYVGRDKDESDVLAIAK